MEGNDNEYNSKNKTSGLLKTSFIRCKTRESCSLSVIETDKRIANTSVKSPDGRYVKVKESSTQDINPDDGWLDWIDLRISFQRIRE